MFSFLNKPLPKEVLDYKNNIRVSAEEYDVCECREQMKSKIASIVRNLLSSENELLSDISTKKLMKNSSLSNTWECFQDAFKKASKWREDFTYAALMSGSGDESELDLLFSNGLFSRLFASLVATDLDYDLTSSSTEAFSADATAKWLLYGGYCDEDECKDDDPLGEHVVSTYGIKTFGELKEYVENKRKIIMAAARGDEKALKDPDLSVFLKELGAMFDNISSKFIIENFAYFARTLFEGCGDYCYETAVYGSKEIYHYNQNKDRVPEEVKAVIQPYIDLFDNPTGIISHGFYDDKEKENHYVIMQTEGCYNEAPFVTTNDTHPFFMDAVEWLDNELPRVREYFYKDAAISNPSLASAA